MPSPVQSNCGAHDTIANGQYGAVWSMGHTQQKRYYYKKLLVLPELEKKSDEDKVIQELISIIIIFSDVTSFDKLNFSQFDWVAAVAEWYRYRTVACFVTATRGLLATDHVILNHGQVTWTTPELAPPLLTTTPHQREDVSALDRFNVHRCPTRRVFSATGLEPVTKQATVRYLYHSATAATLTAVKDEAHFWLNGYVNKQNCRIWSEANPQVHVETPLHPEKLTVWCALWAGGILLQKR
ncbi:uncharacterized protein TNCV_998101 [Trichonephila clavipes]|nr:uncharacterized protein TNCV_998101 [Trichonephila clavipes]